MSDPLADIVPGSDVRPLLKSTARHNLISDAVRWVQAQRRGASPGTGYSFTDHCLLHVQNASGEKRTKGEVLAIDGLAVTPDDNLDGFLAHPVLKGVKPADEHVGKFVVLQSSAEPLEVVMGLLIGVTVAKLNVNSEDDEYADVSADSYELSTGGSGAAEIIAKQSGTGSKWGVVRIGVATRARKARLTSNLDANGYATAQPVAFNSSSKSYDDDSEQDEITVYETMGCYCGIKGELIEVRSAGTDSGGETIWEVVRGGATHHTGSLQGELTQGGSVDATVDGAEDTVTVTVYDILLPSGDDAPSLQSGTFVVFDYNFMGEDSRWEVTGAPGDECEECPDPCA